jgi:hypothetical protein
VVETEFHHCERVAGKTARPRTVADIAHRDHRVRKETVPRKLTPLSEGNTRPGPGIAPRAARPGRR